MYCSVKFLSPIVTAGLPLPGSDAVVEPVEPPPPLLLSLPHAAADNASAAAISAAMLRNQVRVVMRVLLWGLGERRARCWRPRSGSRRSRCGHAARAGSPVAAHQRRARRR